MGPKLEEIYTCRGLLGGSPTLANLENDHGFIRNTSLLV